MNITMSMDGVLRSETGDLIPEGLIMYRAMKVVGRVILLTSLDQKLADIWLVMHNMADYDDLIDNSVVVDPDEDLRLRQIAVSKTRGPIELYIDSDPATVAEALKQGMPTCLFSSPKYARLEFRPDAPKGVRKWDDIVAERNRQHAMKAVDKRVQPDELAIFE